MVAIIIRPVFKLKSVIICKRYFSSYYLSIASTAHEESQEVVKPVACVHVWVVLWKVNRQKYCGTAITELTGRVTRSVLHFHRVKLEMEAIFLTVKSENNSESFATSCFNISSVTKAFKQAVDWLLAGFIHLHITALYYSALLGTPKMFVCQ